MTYQDDVECTQTDGVAAHTAPNVPPEATCPARSGKLRLDRGVLRWWLLIVGAVVIDSNWQLFWIGTAFVIVGAALHLLSKCYLRQNRVITQSGPYRFVRNPFYLGNLIAETGLLLVIGQWWLAAIYLPVWFFVYTIQIRKEEAKLLRIFGEEYATYKRAVPRLIPLPWRFLPATPSAFSWRNPNIRTERAIERSTRLASYPFLLMCVNAIKHKQLQAVDQIRDPALWLLASFLLLITLGWLSSAIFSHIKQPPPALS